MNTAANAISEELQLPSCRISKVANSLWVSVKK